MSFVLLTLVGEGGAGPHDIKLAMERGRVYWTAAPSQYYAEIKRLHGFGLLHAEKTPGKTRERTHYTLTDTGRAALRDWVKTPAAFPKLLQEPAVRLLAAGLVGSEPVLKGLAALRADLDALDADMIASEERAAAFPGRANALLLNHRLSRRIIAAHRDWLDDVEEQFGHPAVEKTKPR